MCGKCQNTENLGIVDLAYLSDQQCMDDIHTIAKQSLIEAITESTSHFCET